MEATALAVTSVFVLTAVAGATELVKRLWAKDFEGTTIIALSGVIGALAGAFVIDGLTVANGIVAGLSASGLITTLQKIGEGTPSVPKNLPRR